MFYDRLYENVIKKIAFVFFSPDNDSYATGNEELFLFHFHLHCNMCWRLLTRMKNIPTASYYCTTSDVSQIPGRTRHKNESKEIEEQE